jgi:CheY-like chemotaxis protein
MLSVLIVDDEKDLLDLVRHFLERYGDMKVDTTTSSKEALTKIQKEEYDALVVDYYMPEITGIELLKIIRAKGDSTPVIIFTGVGRELAAIDALNNGADFFLQKGDDPKTQFRELVHMIRRAKERRSVGRSLGTSQRIISDVMGFSQEPMMAIDREGTVIAWNPAMEELSGVVAEVMVGKNDHAQSEPFYGKKRPMLADLVFSTDAELAALNYTVVSREKGAVTAWTKISRPGEDDRVFWMRALPLYDGKGVFIGAVEALRDITDSIGTMLKEPVSAETAAPAEGSGQKGGSGFINRLTGKAKSEYKAAVRLYYREGKYAEAMERFDRAVEIDPSRASVWNDRGLCLKDMGKYEEAKKSFERALELEPRDEEYLFDYGEVLETIGVLYRKRKVIDLAITTFATVTEINPNNASAWNHLGICIKETGRDEESRQAFERSRSILRAKKDQMFHRKRESVL